MAEKRKDRKGRNLKEGENQMNDGRYRFRYTDKAGERHAIYSWKLVPTDKTPKGKKDTLSLRELEDSLKKDMIDGIDTAKGTKLTLNKLFDEYISEKHDLKESTLNNYLYMYDKFVREDIGLKRITNIKYSTMKKYYNGLMQVGMTDRTLETIHGLLHPTFRLAVRDGIIRINPTDGLMGDIKKSGGWGRPKKHALSIREQELFIQYLSESKVFGHWLPLFTVLLGTGMRVSEAVGLRWSDCDFKNNTISINHNLLYRSIDGKMKWFITTPKTASGCRTIPMLKEVKNALMNERKRQSLEGCQNLEVDGYSHFIFRSTTDNLIHATVINKTIDKVLKYYNAQEKENAEAEHRQPELIRHFSVHSLRHTFCTRFCENETNVKVIQEIMGHANITTTMNIYAEATESKKQESFSNLEGKIKIS